MDVITTSWIYGQSMQHMDLQKRLVSGWSGSEPRTRYAGTTTPRVWLERSPKARSTLAAWWGGAFAIVAGLVLGGLTDWGQSRLPWYAGSLANSAGSWVLVAFLVALGGSRLRQSIGRGGACMVGLTIGYYFTVAGRGIPVAAKPVIFWLVASMVFGPLVGLAAGWVRRGGPIQMGAGAGIFAGLLGGEAVYALRYLPSTSTAYWTIQLLVALSFAVGLAWRGSQRATSLFASALALFLVAGVVCAIEVSA